MIVDSLITNIATDTASKLIEEWITLRKSKKAEELATEDWKQLEKAYMERDRCI